MRKIHYFLFAILATIFMGCSNDANPCEDSVLGEGFSSETTKRINSVSSLSFERGSLSVTQQAILASLDSINSTLPGEEALLNNTDDFGKTLTIVFEDMQGYDDGFLFGWTLGRTWQEKLFYSQIFASAFCSAYSAIAKIMVGAPAKRNNMDNICTMNRFEYIFNSIWQSQSHTDAIQEFKKNIPEFNDYSNIDNVLNYSAIHNLMVPEILNKEYPDSVPSDFCKGGPIPKAVLYQQPTLTFYNSIPSVINGDLELEDVLLEDPNPHPDKIYIDQVLQLFMSAIPKLGNNRGTFIEDMILLTKKYYDKTINDETSDDCQIIIHSGLIVGLSSAKYWYSQLKSFGDVSI